MYSVENITVQGSPMEVLVFQPEGAGPYPGVVVAQHLPVAHRGLQKDPFTIDVGERFAAAGYACIIPHVFHWWPADEDIAVKRAEFRDDRTVADLNAAYAMLAGLDSVDSSRIAIMGHCWGGRVTWVGACSNPDYKAAIMLYGGRVKLAMGGVPAIELAGQINCPMMGLFGNDDQNPSPADVDDMSAALTAAGIAHEFHRYDGAGHGFQDYTNPERFRAEQSADAWKKIFAFLDTTIA
jgi:carboxymethylenebutenolidase